MSMIVGSGDFTYEAIGAWGELPEGYEIGDVGGIGIDEKDNVYIFNRSKHPMLIFSQEGKLLNSWGEGLFPRAHGLHMAADGTIWLTDDTDHTVRQFTRDGKLLLTLGTSGKPAPLWSGKPFNRPTHSAISPSGDVIYVCDGYGNGRVHKYDPKGRLIGGWGQCGCKPGEFNMPHNIWCDKDGWVYVADRENHRVQVFDGDGRYETQWNNLHRSGVLYMQPNAQGPVWYVGEIGSFMAINREMPGIGPRISILNQKGEPLARIESDPAAGTAPGQFVSAHGIAVDSRGDIYSGEVAAAGWVSVFPGKPVPQPLRRLQKFVKRARSY